MQQCNTRATEAIRVMQQCSLNDKITCNIHGKHRTDRTTEEFLSVRVQFVTCFGSAYGPIPEQSRDSSELHPDSMRLSKIQAVLHRMLIILGIRCEEIIKSQTTAVEFSITRNIHFPNIISQHNNDPRP